ncbi:cation transporter [Oenococcus sicerae]|uniref:Cation transporter n=1 Tax=Oenococcus sicerae TaxID=2203724 RepID=A0AAJ1REU4_9LACO|nr:cation transporter [Oenococcus sicerae]MDN6900596.1 cation transporter [Oenococcus sicerae]
MQQKAIEQHTLMAGILANLFMGAAGMAAYYTSQIEALFVDAYFTVISLVSGLVAISISKLSTKVSKRFPNGLFILEPIFSLVQSLLTIVLLVSALATVSWNAYKYFAYGQGKIMDVGPIIPYEIIMLLLSFSLSAYYNQQNKKINQSSTMLLVETKGTLIDGIMSTGIALAALTILFINQASIFNFLRYTGDFFITFALVLLTIRMPLQIIKKTFIEISGGTISNRHIQKIIENCLHKHLHGTLALSKCSIYKVGMSLRVDVLLNSKSVCINKKELSAAKDIILIELKKQFEYIHVAFYLD